jgi:hypothetical protein
MIRFHRPVQEAIVGFSVPHTAPAADTGVRNGFFLHHIGWAHRRTNPSLIGVGLGGLWKFTKWSYWSLTQITELEVALRNLNFDGIEVLHQIARNHRKPSGLTASHGLRLAPVELLGVAVAREPEAGSWPTAFEDASVGRSSQQRKRTACRMPVRVERSPTAHVPCRTSRHRCPIVEVVDGDE